MYVKNSNHVWFYRDEHNPNTEKVTFGRVSEALKTGKVDENGEAIYEFESWPCKFVGKAREKALALKDKDRITLTEWTARNPYNKEKKRSYPYLMVMDFEMRELPAPESMPEPAAVEGDFELLEEADGNLPF